MKGTVICSTMIAAAVFTAVGIAMVTLAFTNPAKYGPVRCDAAANCTYSATCGAYKCECGFSGGVSGTMSCLRGARSDLFLNFGVLFTAAGVFMFIMAPMAALSACVPERVANA